MSLTTGYDVFEVLRSDEDQELARQAAALALGTFYNIPSASATDLDAKLSKLERTDSTLLVAVDQQRRFAGTAALTILHDQEEALGYIFDVVVVPQKRRENGIGKRLMTAVANKARALGATETILLTADDTVDFYERLGYKPDQSEAHAEILRSRNGEGLSIYSRVL